VCALGIINDTVKQRRSKAMDMRFYWIKEDRVALGQYVVHWRRGSNNLADYFTKHHSPSHHRLMRLQYLVDLRRPASLQGCVEHSIQQWEERSRIIMTAVFLSCPCHTPSTTTCYNLRTSSTLFYFIIFGGLQLDYKRHEH